MNKFAIAGKVVSHYYTVHLFLELSMKTEVCGR